ncbi:MAG: lytic transglycosylase domain-containing protein [Acidobacteriota bacterium]|nr:lytic transglycosylase domain-containing protein [Acidobacteriota bacterium]
MKHDAKQQRWMKRGDYRLICDCQQHARANSAWRRALRIASRGVAVLVSVPLALSAFDIPISAMNLPPFDLHAVKTVAKAHAPQPQQQMRIFTTPAVREQFLTPAKRDVTLDVFKDEYFRRHVPYGEIIVREARKNKLAPELVAAMVHTESDFRTTLVSHKSAQGLMQIVPSTARLLGISDPFDPQQNIAAGTKYFRYLLNRFENEQMALAAYNAGEGNVERFGGIPPFGETREYIEKVSRRANRYRQRVQTTYVASLRDRRSETAR